MSAEGIEPSTNGLKGRCSAIELRARLAKQDFITNWLSGQGQLQDKSKTSPLASSADVLLKLRNNELTLINRIAQDIANRDNANQFVILQHG